jgi:hypothetical protein
MYVPGAHHSEMGVIGWVREWMDTDTLVHALEETLR